MKTVLTITDSVEGTIFDLLRCTTTIKDFGLDPLAVVPRISYKDNTSEENDVSEMLDYAFSECEFAALSIGFLTEPNVIRYIADKLGQNKSAPVVCCPSLISDEGEIQVDGEVFDAICDGLLKHVDLLVVNTMEAEAFCGFGCYAKNDYLRAATKIVNVYGCGVFIRGDDKKFRGPAGNMEGGKTIFAKMHRVRGIQRRHNMPGLMGERIDRCA